MTLLSADVSNAYIDYEETSGNRWIVGGYTTNDLFAFADGGSFASSLRIGISKASGGTGSRFQIYDGTTNLRYVSLHQ